MKKIGIIALIVIGSGVLFAQDPTINNHFYGPVIINQGSTPQPEPPPQTTPEAPPADEAPEEPLPSQESIQPVFTAVKPRPHNPTLTLGVKGSYFYDRSSLISDVGRYDWVVAPSREFGGFIDLYLNRFIIATYEVMWARDAGYISTGETIQSNSVSFNAMFKLRAPIASRFALTGGVGVFYSFGTVSSGESSEGIHIRGLLTEFAVETSLGDDYQHVFTLGVRNKWRFGEINRESIKQQPIGISASYGYRW